MSYGSFHDPAMMVPLRLEERNQMVQTLINEYKQKHGMMDVGVGLVGLIPGAGIPALITAIAMQSPFIYQPLARKIAEVYLAPPDDLSKVGGGIIYPAAELDIILSVTADFGGEFIQQIAMDMLADVGIGAAATFIPFVGAFAAAGLDYIIATKMTNRVGQMVAIYFQNGARWRGGQKATYEAAKDHSGSIDDIRHRMTDVRATLLRNIKPMVDMMRSGGMTNQQMLSALLSQRIPVDLAKEAIGNK